MNIRQKLVSATQAAKITNGKNNAKKYVVVHETDNTRKGADADAHARLQINGNSREASWHWQVDDKEAVQSFEHFWACWAAGTFTGNNEGIHVEICVNSDGNYTNALQNAASLVAKIMKDENIPISKVVQHNYFSGKIVRGIFVLAKYLGRIFCKWLRMRVLCSLRSLSLTISNIVF